jgi:type II secretory pathway component PulF
MADINAGKKSLRDLLGKSLKGEKQKKEVIYGLYDRARQPFFTRIDDFLIDHGRVPLEEKAYFFHLLAVMLDSGIPLIAALKMLAGRTRNERFKRILNTVAFNVVQGKTLSEAMSRFSDVFGDMEVGIIRSGEAVGNLDKMLFKLSDQMDRTHGLQVKLVTASIYPLAVLGVLVLVASGMLMWVIPGLVGLLEEGGLERSDFPFATRFLIGVSEGAAAYWWLILFGIITAFILFKAWVGSENGKFKWDLFKLKVPVLGILLRKVLVLRFVSMLGVLIESGLPVMQSLKIIASSLSNELYRLKTWDLIAKVSTGEKISESLAETPFLFPDTVTQMLAVAEQSASIGMISEKIAAHYDREIDNSLKRLTSLFEPIMIVFVGFTVALLALAILTPIFKLTEIVS